ncbi:hypothetical protein E2320_003888 [Naja naja]|nr:hypothetical protein E2320_003888 [Naja naja]
MFLEANSLQDTTEQRKRPLFLRYCGNCLYKAARTLAAPKDVEIMEWKELQKMLEEYYAPAASSLAHRLDFYCREQKPGETINDYLRSPRDIAAGCEFENVEITLRDRIVVGMRDLRLQRKLITKKSISLKEPKQQKSQKNQQLKLRNLSVHSAWGTTSKYQGEGDIGELSEEEEEEIHRVKPDRRSGPQGTSQRPLWYVGCKGNHPRVVCKFRDTICCQCKRRGHIVEACRANLPAYPSQRQAGFPNHPHGPQQRGFQRPPHSNYRKKVININEKGTGKISHGNMMYTALSYTEIKHINILAVLAGSCSLIQLMGTWLIEEQWMKAAIKRIRLL